MNTQNTDDISKRIPTYLIQNTNNGLEFIGNGYYKDSYPSLVFLRGKEYRFLFKDSNSLIEMYDEDGNLLRTTSAENTSEPFIIKLGNNFPNKIFYRLKNIKSSDYGIITLRDLDQIYGKVISYNYSKSTRVTDNKFYDIQTDDNGTFSLYYTNSEKYFYTMDFDIFASGGFDSLVTDVFNVPTYSSTSLLNLKTVKGSLILNTFTTLYWFLSKRFTHINYSDLNKKICNYFGLSNEYDILTDDIIAEYMQNKLPIGDYVKLLIFTSIVEFISNQPNQNLDNLFYESIVNQILENKNKFNYNDVDFMGNDSVHDSDMFKSILYVLVSKIEFIVNQNRKKNCILDDLLSLIHKFRTAIITKTISYQLFLKSDLNLKTGKLKLPSQSKIVLLSYINGCTIAPFGKYAKINLDDDCVYKILNQNLPSEPEVVNELIGKILYIKNSENQFFCYKISNFINYDYELPEIKSTSILQSFDQSNYCCELENLENDKLQYDENENVEEQEVLDFVLFNGDKNKILSSNITNKNKPYDKKTLRSIFYINEFIPEMFKYTPPIFIGINKKYSSKVKDIKLSFDGVVVNYEIDNIRYDYGAIGITNTNVSDDILEFRTSDIHGFQIGDDVEFKNTSKNGILNGVHSIVGKTQKTFTIKRDINLNINDGELVGTYGDVLSKRFSKIYCDVTDFSKNDKLVFSKSANINENIIVHDIKQDYLGKFLLVNGIIPKDLSIFSKKEIITNENETLRYKFEVDSEFYNIPDLNLEQYHLWVYSPEVPGQALRTRMDAFISQIEISSRVESVDQFALINSFARGGGSSSNDNANVNTNVNNVNLNDDKNDSPTPTPTPTPSSVSNLSDSSVPDIPDTSDSLSKDNILKELELVRELLPSFSSESFNIKNSESLNKNVSVTEIVDEQSINESYHTNRKYFREEFEFKVGEDGYDEVYDWNGDGVINSDELKILERYIVTRPKTVEEYNEFRGDYPIAKVLPASTTATYACQEYCCHDDFTETSDFNEEDVLIYDAFQAYIDSLGETEETDFANFLFEYLVLEKQGLTPTLETEITYMPTDPRQYNLCGDYSANGEIDSDDSNIYYAYQLYMKANSSPPSTIADFETYYDTLVASGIVPNLIGNIKLLPSLKEETDILSETGTISKNCEDISWKDGKIYDEWLRQNKPVDIDEFNANRLSDVPRACFLPLDGGPGFGDYDDFGDIGFTFSRDRDTGIVNL
jgi:hypothetical protein